MLYKFIYIYQGRELLLYTVLHSRDFQFFKRFAAVLKMKQDTDIAQYGTEQKFVMIKRFRECLDNLVTVNRAHKNMGNFKSFNYVFVHSGMVQSMPVRLTS
jgi:hypothetical protein